MANRLSNLDRFALVGLVVLGLVLRATHLDRKPLWVDEAESSINAFTILQHGVPRDRYLGLPTYENTLTQVSPNSVEYEFRDSSYSTAGLATYHGWLPLYSIAASLTLFGIGPDAPGIHVQHDAASRRRRTIAVRLPAVIFGGVCLVFLFFTGLSLFGRDAAWTALVGGVVSASQIDIDSQARYYSLTVMLSVVCCLVAWKALWTRDWRFYLWAALPFTLLFYTHLLTFLAIAFAFGVMALPGLRERRNVFWKLCAFVAVVTAFTLPWMIGAGFFQQKTSTPRAWPLLTFPQDLFLYPLEKTAYAKLFGFAALSLAGLFLARHWISPRIRPHLHAVKAPVLFLSILMLAGYFAFLVFIPAASFFFNRLSLSLMGPGLLLVAVLFSLAARCIHADHSEWMAPVLIVLFLGVADRLRPLVPEAGAEAQWRDLDVAVSYLNQRPLTDQTRIYATPNDHLMLTYYTGLPIQSIAPVRQDFLTHYAGEVIFLERRQPPAGDDSALGWRRIESVFQLGNEEARRLSFVLSTYDSRQFIASRVQSVDPPLTSFPELGRPLLEKYRWERLNEEERLMRECDRLPIFRHYRVRTWTDWWQTFFYRFSEPTSRSGDRANYAVRLRNARAVFLPNSTWVAYESPAPAPNSNP